MNGLTLIIYTLVTVVTVLLRVYLQINMIDSGTGFYVDAGFLPTAFNVLLVVFVAAIFISTMVKRPSGSLSYSKLNSTLSIFLGFVVEVVSFTQLIEIFFSIGNGAPLPVLLLITLLVSAAAGITFVFDGFAGLSGQPKNDKGIFTCVFPTVWMILLTLSTFTSYKLTVEISDNMLHILAMVFTLLYFAARTKLIIGETTDRNRSQAVFTGLCASYFTFTLALPRLIVGSVGSSFMQGPSIATTLVVLTLGIYCLMTAMPVLRCKQQNFR